MALLRVAFRGDPEREFKQSSERRKISVEIIQLFVRFPKIITQHRYLLHNGKKSQY